MDGRRPYLALALAIAMAIAIAVVPASRAWLVDEVLSPVRAQAEPESGLRAAYSFGSMAFWALLGLAFAWAAYDLVFARLGYAPDRRFFLALSPFLLFGPLFHALLAAGALPRGGLAWLAAEPPVYLTTAALAIAALVAGRALRQPLWVPFGIGAALDVPLVALAAARFDGSSATQLLVVAVLALAPALALGYAWHRWRGDDLGASTAVVFAHALDGATTWMVLRDPFGLGFVGFGEKNPVSETLVGLANGWPYYALKLALPLVLLGAVKTEAGQERTRAFLLFAVFVLGYGPGMSNLLQVLLS